jgi:sterol desaturase/sphingolipid hydroxylase (fatty acid hydroxylase superfamily)
VAERVPNRPFMRLNAKTTSVIAVGSAAVLAGCAFAWREVYTDTVHLDDLQLLYTYIYEALRAVGSTNIGRLGSVVAVVLAAEIFFVGWKGSSLFRLIIGRSGSAVMDTLNFFFVLLNLTLFLEIVLSLGGALLASQFIAWVSSQYGWSRIPLPSAGILDFAMSFAIYWLITSFFQYWVHRMMHLPMFWPLHRFHHAGTELNIITNFRLHPLEPVITRFFSLVSPLIFLDIPQRVLLIYFLFSSVFDLFAHSQLPWSYGWFGRWVVHSPRVHQVHHSADDEHQNLHFSNCPLWDHVFGTWYNGTKLPTKFGIADPAYEKRPLTQVFLDTWIFYENLTRWARSWPTRARATSAASPPAAR